MVGKRVQSVKDIYCISKILVSCSGKVSETLQHLPLMKLTCTIFTWCVPRIYPLFKPDFTFHEDVRA